MSREIDLTNISVYENNPFSHKYVLKLWVSPENVDYHGMMKDHIRNHNTHILNDPNPNSGFDLLVLESVSFKNQFDALLVNHKIKGAMFEYCESSDTWKSLPFYLYPRSSIYKTPFSLANSVGIIDSGYRGWICSALRFFGDSSYSLESNTRLTQICHCNLAPFYIQMVEFEEDLGNTTRGTGGFGSTGESGSIVR